MYDLIPLIESWLEQQGFSVSVLANRVEGVKKTGFLSSEKVTVFLEDYIGLCSVKIQGQATVCTSLSEYLKSLPIKAPKSEREIIIREREIVTMPCPYCGTLVSVTERKCPNCGAYIKG
jgi:predicted RNA-binding Zn-ribbon protein involved in translation (DUF1610 family)